MILREAVQWWAQKMEAVLRRNDYKRHWQDTSMKYLQMRAAGEFCKMQDAYHRYRKNPTKRRAQLLAKECTDVSNIMMMISDYAFDTEHIK